MIANVIKEVIVNIQEVIQIPRSRIEALITLDLVPSERDSLNSPS